ncbi:prepilin peptidase [Nocardiopsis changdeensis]|uniref:Prepilin peptidase n=1 Tax=Nocardiopsis changdeensis TaxID=2831969 RepID=A0ABX8BIZ6_9ACTN|nr:MULTISPECIES: A24 family peptidase [Nocardiopsis]QUX21299.1 prepilin peptidase [Nocardiopsis changdeensis]QYX37230.1 A24 family peptidase [Nocardiopsis sp. MT53]
MPTPSALAPLADHWAVAVIAVTALAGLLAGHVGGRLVPLFGPAGPADPHTRAPLDAAATRDGAAQARAGHAGAPEPEPAPGEDGPPPPRCPHCLAELRFWRWFPLVADRAFRGRGSCPHCEQTVRSHPGAVLLAVPAAALAGAAAVLHPDWTPLWLPAVLWLVAVGSALSVVDLRVQRLPDALVRPAYPVAAALIALAALTPPDGPAPGRLLDALLGMVLVTVLYWLLWRIHPRGMGLGDVRLSGLTGLYAGWAAGPLGALTAVFWAFAAFSAVGLVLIALRRASPGSTFPLGPFMLAATLATVLAAGPLLPEL